MRFYQIACFLFGAFTVRGASPTGDPSLVEATQLIENQPQPGSLRSTLLASGSQPVLGPSGVFTGASVDGRIMMTAAFSSISVDLVFNIDGTVYISGAGIPYTMNRLRVELIEGPALRGLFNQVGSGLVSSSLSIKYNPTVDELSFSFLNLFHITGTKVASIPS
jgi:hypothetical protein